MDKNYILAIDQGTTNSRAHIFSSAGKLVGTSQLPLTQHYPKPGWVEQDPEEMWMNTLTCCRQAISASQVVAKQILGIGITNQRETTLIWHKKTGKPIYPAISWKDKRTAEFCHQLSRYNHLIQEKTGLLLDSYFSASKIAWLLDNIPQVRKQAEKGELLFGTVDTFLLWRLTKGKIHATDASNASRTLLFNIQTQQWDQELLNLFHIPETILPTVLDSSADFGVTEAEFLGIALPIAGVAGDQQAALIGQTCFQPGMIKSTFGTGCFILINTGDKFVKSTQRLLTTVAYRLQGKVTYGLEGCIFSAGSIVKWLKDNLKLIQTAAETETLAESIEDTGGVYLLPAFAGLGAPYWNPHARAAIIGLTYQSNIAHIARAALEAVVYQVRDLLEVITKDFQFPLSSMRVDGGMAVNNWFLQFLTDMVDLKICRSQCTETTALGAAFLAGLQLGVYSSLVEISQLCRIDKEFSPDMKVEKRIDLYQGWNSALKTIHIKL